MDKTTIKEILSDKYDLGDFDENCKLFNKTVSTLNMNTVNGEMMFELYLFVKYLRYENEDGLKDVNWESQEHHFINNFLTLLEPIEKILEEKYITSHSDKNRDYSKIPKEDKINIKTYFEKLSEKLKEMNDSIDEVEKSKNKLIANMVNSTNEMKWTLKVHALVNKLEKG